MSEAEKLLTVKDVAAMCQVEEHTIYKLCREGKIAHIRISYKTIRIYRDAVDVWLASLSVGEPVLRHVSPQPRQLLQAAPRQGERIASKSPGAAGSRHRIGGNCIP